MKARALCVKCGDRERFPGWAMCRQCMMIAWRNVTRKIERERTLARSKGASNHGNPKQAT